MWFFEILLVVALIPAVFSEKGIRVFALILAGVCWLAAGTIAFAVLGLIWNAIGGIEGFLGFDPKQFDRVDLLFSVLFVGGLSIILFGGLGLAEYLGKKRNGKFP